MCASLSSTSIRESEGQKDGQKGQKRKRVAATKCLSEEEGEEELGEAEKPWKNAASRKGLGEPKNREKLEGQRSGLPKKPVNGREAWGSRKTLES